MKYDKFQQLIDTMDGEQYDYKKGYERSLTLIQQRLNGRVFSLSDHTRGMLYSLLSNQRPWHQIDKHRADIDEIFHNFDTEYIKNEDPSVFVENIKKIKCGNKYIVKQISAMKDNIETLERIEKDEGSIDEYFNKTPKYSLLKELSQGKFKLKQMATPLTAEYLKNVGLDIIKPDVHVRRILARLGYSKNTPASIKECFEICQDIAKEFGCYEVVIDSILWQYCADKYFEKCTEKPKCESCKVEDCLGRI